MNTNIAFSDLVGRHGDDGARDVLRTIEIVAQMPGNVIYLSDDVRFRQAFEALCNTNFSGVN